MSSYDFFDDIGSSSIIGASPTDYLTDIPDSDLLTDPRFVDEMREYYALRGERFDNDDDLRRKWYDDRTFAELNLTIGTTGDVIDSYGASGREAELKRRMVAGYQKLPMFWQDGGMGDEDGWQVARSVSWALATDPLSYVGGFGAAKAGGAAMKTAAQTGGKITREGAKAGFKQGALTEAAIAVPLNTAADAAIQGRDMQLGLQDEFSYGQSAAAAGLGFGLGVGVGGAAGAVTALTGGRAVAKGLQEADLEQVFTARPGSFAKEPRPVLTEDLTANVGVIDQEMDTTATIKGAEAKVEAEAEAKLNEVEVEPAMTGIQAEDLDQTAIDTRLMETRDSLERAEADPDTDPDILKSLREDNAKTEAMSELGTRLNNEQAEIKSLLGSNNEAKRAIGEKRANALRKSVAQYRKLVGDFDGEDADQAIADIGSSIPEPVQEADVVDINTGQPTGTPDTLASAPADPTKTVKPIEDVFVIETAKVEGTDEIVETKIPATQLRDRVQARVRTMLDLQACMG